MLSVNYLTSSRSSHAGYGKKLSTIRISPPKAHHRNPLVWPELQFRLLVAAGLLCDLLPQPRTSVAFRSLEGQRAESHCRWQPPRAAIPATGAAVRRGDHGMSRGSAKVLPRRRLSRIDEDEERTRALGGRKWMYHRGRIVRCQYLPL